MTITAAISRTKTLIEFATSDAYRENRQDVHDLLDAVDAGSNKTYMVFIDDTEFQEVVQSNIKNSMLKVRVQLRRQSKGGSANSSQPKDVEILLAEDMSLVDDAMLYPSNWDFDNTRIIMITQDSPTEFEPTEDEKHIVATTTYLIHLRDIRSALNVCPSD